MMSTRLLQVRLVFCLIFFFCFVQVSIAQVSQKIKSIETELEQLKQKETKLRDALEAAKCERIIETLDQIGLPNSSSESVIKHSAMQLVYSEEHEQAKWVAHIITPDIIDGRATRSNDFREDPKIKSGTAIEQDYFLKELQADSTYKYDGFGFDRGHLAPSADFRWSKKALSESYFYSNMSPQRPDFNREKWAELEGKLRGYIYANPKSELIVLTGPILTDDLPHIERSVNKVSIPEYYWKVAIDIKKNRGIGFLIPNKKVNYPLSMYAMSIDEIEEKTGFDFYNKLDRATQNTLESNFTAADWLPEVAAGDVEPLYPPSLPKAHFNTIQAKQKIGRDCTVCGTVVSARRSRKGNVLLNLDKQFPNQVFTVFIRKEHVINFSYDPEFEFKGKIICVKSELQKMGSTPAAFIEHEDQLKLYKEDQK